MNSATKRLINFRLACPSDRRFESLQERAKAFLLFILERQEWEPREAAAVAALVHDVLYAGDSALRNDELRGPQNHGVQFARLFLLTLTDQIVEGEALLR